jgi:hypothetical protein
MKRLSEGVSLASLILLVLVIAGCDDGSTGSDDDYVYASVRFIHSAPSTDMIDFAYMVYGENYYADAATEVSYGEQNGYFSFAAGSRSFRAYLSSTSISAASVTFTLAENGKYTVVANDLDAAINPELLAVADTTQLASEGKSFLRFLNVSADAPEMDIKRADNSLLVTGLGRYEASGYLELDAGTYQFTAFSSGTDLQLLALDPLTLTSTVSYTVILSGTAYALPGAQLNAKIYQETGVQ